MTSETGLRVHGALPKSAGNLYDTMASRVQRFAYGIVTVIGVVAVPVPHAFTPATLMV